MAEDFRYDVFLSHSAKDKAVVRPLAERLRSETPDVKAQGRGQKKEVQFPPLAPSLQPLLNGSTAQFLYIDCWGSSQPAPIEKEIT